MVALSVAGWQYAAARAAKSEAEARARVEQGPRASALAEQPGREMEALRLGIDALAGHGAKPAQAPSAVVEGMIHGLMQMRQLATLKGHTDRVWAVAFSPDGSRLLTASSDMTARLWVARGGKPLATLQGHTDRVGAVAFSPDGTRVLTASDDKTARLWDAYDGKPLATLQGHTGSVGAVAFSPDGACLLTASADNTARLWDAKNGELLAILTGHRGAVTSVAFSPDGRHLATASDDGTARIWAATPEGFLIQACQYLRPWPAFAEVAETCAPYVNRTP
jgi:hypothetical protein